MKIQSKIRRSVLALLAVSLIGGISVPTGFTTVKAAAPYISNASLLPKYVPDSQVTLDENGSPDWMKSLIMTQFRIETVTPGGTFQSAIPVLDHYQEAGVNGIWLNPIYKRPAGEVQKGNNGYGNWGPDTVEPTLTGKSTTEESYKVIKAFVDEAHKRDIRIFFDIIVWGTAKDSPLVTSHPEFYNKRNGAFVEAWGGYTFNWNSAALKAWFTEAAVNLILKTGADGFRVDLAPDTSGYYFKEVKDELLKRGRKVMIMSEGPSQHNGAFDIDQSSVGWGPEPHAWDNPAKLAEQRKKYGDHGLAYINNNIVDSVKSGHLIGDWEMQSWNAGGTLKYYTFNLLNHDDSNPLVRGNRVRFAYQALFSPFIPIWWVGEEFINPGAQIVGVPSSGVMYYTQIQWELLGTERNRTFYEDIKKYIRIRRSNPEIFEYFPEALNDTNIETVRSEIVGWGPNALQAYVRYQNNRAIVIVPNNNGKEYTFKITPDYANIGLNNAYGFRITDLYTGKVIKQDSVKNLLSFETKIAAVNLGVYQIEALDKNMKPKAAGPADAVVKPDRTGTGNASSTPGSSTGGGSASSQRPVTGGDTESAGGTESPGDTEPPDNTSSEAVNSDGTSPGENESSGPDSSDSSKDTQKTGGDKDPGVPVLPIVIGAAVLAAAAAAVILILRRKNAS